MGLITNVVKKHTIYSLLLVKYGQYREIGILKIFGKFI